MLNLLSNIITRLVEREGDDGVDTVAAWKDDDDAPSLDRNYYYKYF
jgi:hypothetical protein